MRASCGNAILWLKNWRDKRIGDYTNQFRENEQIFFFKSDSSTFISIVMVSYWQLHFYNMSIQSFKMERINILLSKSWWKTIYWKFKRRTFMVVAHNFNFFTKSWFSRNMFRYPDVQIIFMHIGELNAFSPLKTNFEKNIFRPYLSTDFSITSRWGLSWFRFNYPSLRYFSRTERYSIFLWRW